MHISLNNNESNFYFGIKNISPKNVLSKNERKILDNYKTLYNYSDTKSVQWKTKRALDVLFSIAGGILTAPLMAAAALAVKITSKGPIIFKQERIGRDGKTFIIYKFRTMKVNSDNEKSVQTPNDSRITKVGKILRKYSIDELPQLFNILKGDMSLAGPRPLTIYEHKIRKQNNNFLIRYVFKPGASINYKTSHYVEDNPKICNFTEKEYIQNWNLRKDFAAYFKILSRIIRGDNY